MFTLQSIFSVAALALGASALVLDPMHNVERGVGVSAHRRHAANVLALRSPAPERRHTPAERRSLRQKRCIANNQATPTSSVQGDDTPPQNNAPAPTTTTPAAQDTPPASTGNGDGNSGSGNSGGGSDTYTGDITYYDIGLGACGYTNNEPDMIAAVSHLLYDGFDGYWGANPNANPICGKQASVTYGGNTIVVSIVDRCEGCAMYDLDLSYAAFGKLADLGVGRGHGMTWHFL